MAERPIFVPTQQGAGLVKEVMVRFTWHPGMALSQKKKNVAALHTAAVEKGFTHLLEISSKSEREVGKKLSAFQLKTRVEGRETTLESAFQGSKVFEGGGPFNDLYELDSRDAKRDSRLRESGRLLMFRLEDKDYPLSPATSFYDWLYINALYPHRSWLVCLQKYDGFTDIEFNPDRSVNCQARSCATFVSLEQRGYLDDAVESFEYFRNLMQAANI